MSGAEGGVLAVVRGTVRPETAAAAWTLASRLGAALTVLYLPGADLAHYGFAETLAPSTAKHDFIAYVQANASRELARTKEAFAHAGAPAERIRWKPGDGPLPSRVAQELGAGAYEMVALCGRASSPGRGRGFTEREAAAVARRLSCPLVYLP
ncbi:MAG: hypothetical protein QMC81_08660 [Thermoanaerobacterales bacterium]|nr:hypothetical protein [Thermoanaerobacterales bacterium]